MSHVMSTAFLRSRTSEVISDRIRSNKIRSTIFFTVKDLTHISLVQV